MSCKDCKTVVNDILDGEKNRMKGMAILPSGQEPNKTAENKALQTIAERLDGDNKEQQWSSHS